MTINSIIEKWYLMQKDSARIAAHIIPAAYIRIVNVSNMTAPALSIN